MSDNLKNYLKELLQKEPLTQKQLLKQLEEDAKDLLKTDGEFYATCKRYPDGQKRVWTLKKESSSSDIPEKDPYQQLLESQQKSDSLNSVAVNETFGDIPEGCEPFSLTCRKARETQKEFCKQCSCYQTCEACNRLK